jgi:hypothetical protein
MVSVRNICVNTLRKGDRDDNNNNNNSTTQYAKPWAFKRQMVHTHTHTHTKPLYEEENVTMLWNQAMHTEVTVNRTDIIIKQEREDMHTYRCGTIRGQKRCVKGSGKEAKSKSLCT